MKTALAFVLAAFLVSPAARAQTATADFDTLSEGFFATTIVDGGITFSDMDNQLGGPQNFAVEQADATLTGVAGFTSPIALGFGGWSPGSGAAFTRIQTFKMSSGTTASFGSVDIFEIGSGAGNTITLEARMGATVVASQIAVIPGGFTVHHYALSVAGSAFDSLWIVGAGASDGGCFFGLIDHVVISGGGPGTSYCFGDGSSPGLIACPCGNAGSSGRGCANSQPGSLGARLASSGTTTPDSIALTASDMLPTAPCIFLQGNSTLVAGAPFGDGVRCAGGQLLRLAVKSAAFGNARFPDPAAADPSVSARSATLGFPISSGATRLYQTYFRDPSLVFCPFPAGNTWNVTNGLQIIWQ